MAAHDTKRPLRRVLRVLAAFLERLLDRRPAGAPAPVPPVTLLVWNAFSMGGTVRTVLRQAGALAAHGREVTVVSVVRHASQVGPSFPFPPGVRVEVLVDRREARTGPVGVVLRWLDGRPPLSGLFSLGREPQASLLIDLQLVRRLLAVRGAVIGTRVGLNLAVARLGHPAAHKIAQEHLQLLRYPPSTRRAIVRHFGRLDAVVCLTEGEADDYRRQFAGAHLRIAVVPNAVPDQLPAAADPASRRIVTVGRLAPSKRFDRLVDAFAAVADAHPGWTLRIVGAGAERARIAAAVERHGLEGRVELVGRSDDVDAELAAASVFALSSRFESFGIVLLEAMAAGLAIVSIDCPLGPRELLTDGRNALTVPGVDELADALGRVLGDEALRRRLGAAARRDVAAFGVSPVTRRWLALLDDLEAPDTTRVPVPV